MHGLMSVWDWFWMVFMILTWVVIAGVLVYVAVRLAIHPPHHRKGHFS